MLRARPPGRRLSSPESRPWLFTPRSVPPEPRTALPSASCPAPAPTCAGRRDAEGQKALFTTGTRFAVHMSGPDTGPTCVLEGRQALTPVFGALNQYQATTHLNGQSTVMPDGERATGESDTIAHHLFTADGERKIMTASLRHLDTFAKTGDTRLFAERNLILDWSETRPSTP